MPEALATVTIAADSGLAEDAVVNQFAIITDGSVAGAAPDIDAALNDFYNDTQASGASIAQYLSNGLGGTSPAACTVRVYDISGHLDGSPHGSPLAETTFGLAARTASTVSLPDEVALVLTLRGSNWASQPIERADGLDPGSAIDRPRQRYSGRLFLGPFNSSANVEVSGHGRPSSTLRTTVLDAGEQLNDALQVAGHNWAVWSRVDEVLRTMNSIQVDDAWDTQRRRGVAPTARTTRLVI